MPTPADPTLADVPPDPPPDPCPPAQQVYSDEDVAKLVADDYATLDEAAKSQTLYVSLAHLADGKTECDMRFYRFGVGQLMNMTSWAKDIVPTNFVDDKELVARVDVRDLEWTPESLAYVMLISERQDYGVIDSGKGKATTVRADWLAAHLTRPAVYGYILRNPEQERLIAAQAKMADTGKGRFGGVYKSIVTVHPRLIERRESDYGSCWITHDFLYRTQALAAMETGQLPPDDVRLALLQFVAREYICSLPNGMHNYQLTGFVTQRRWDGNTCVARNEARDDKLVLNGQCFNCHADGLIPFQDAVRNGASSPSSFILDNFPEQSELDALIAKDQARYVDAISKIPYYDPSYSTPLNEMISLYASRASADMRESPAGAFGAILPKGASAGPIWDDVINPILTLAVDMGVLLPASLIVQDIPETVIPAFKQKYKEAGIDESEGCF